MMIQNFIPVKGRTLAVGQLVEVYFNLHKKMYSIRDKATGLVVAHAKSVGLCGSVDGLTPVKTKVSQAGRQRVIREKRKNVHALIVGYYASAGVGIKEEDKHSWNQLYYNPYQTETFVDRSTMQPPAAPMHYVHCQDKQAFYLN